MVKNCCVLGCSSNTKRNPAISFFRFPTDSTLASMWLQLIGRPDFKPSQYSVICQLHFTRDDFTSGSHHYPITGIGGQRKRLKTKAIPTQNLNGCTNPEVLAEIQMRAKNTIVPHKTAKSMIANTMLNTNLQKSTEAAQIQQLLTSLMPALFGTDSSKVSLNTSNCGLNFTNTSVSSTNGGTTTNLNSTQNGLISSFPTPLNMGTSASSFTKPLSSSRIGQSSLSPPGSFSSTFSTPQGCGLSTSFTTPIKSIPSTSFMSSQNNSFTSSSATLPASFSSSSFTVPAGSSPTPLSTPQNGVSSNLTQLSPNNTNSQTLSFPAPPYPDSSPASPRMISTAVGPIISLPASLQNLTRQGDRSPSPTQQQSNSTQHQHVILTPEPIMSTPILKREPRAVPVEHTVFKQLSNVTTSAMNNSPTSSLSNAPVSSLSSGLVSSLNNGLLSSISNGLVSSLGNEMASSTDYAMGSNVLNVPTQAFPTPTAPSSGTPVAVRGSPSECDLYLELQNSLLALKQNLSNTDMKPANFGIKKPAPSGMLHMSHQQQQSRIQSTSPQEVPMDTGNNNAYIIDVNTYQKLMETVSQKSEKCIQTEQDIKMFSMETEIKQLKDQLYQYELAFNSLINWTEGSLMTEAVPTMLPGDNKLVEGQFIE